MPLTRVSTGGIKDGTILDADISASTIIDGAKLDLSSVVVDFSDTTLTGDARIDNGVTVSTPDFSSVIYDFFQDTPALSGHACFFSIDGKKAYVIDTIGDRIIQLDLTSPWNFNGLTIPSTTQLLIGTEDTAPYGMYISPDGLNLYTTGNFYGRINQYALSEPWEIDTGTFVNNYTVGSADTEGVTFSPDGSRFYTLRQSSSYIREFALTTAWDITTAEPAGVGFTAAGSDAKDLHFSLDGRILVIVYSSSVQFHELTDPWDITTASTPFVYSTSSESTSNYGVYLKPDCSEFFVYGQASDYIYRYSIPSVGRTTIYGPTILNGKVAIGEGVDIYGPATAATLPPGTNTNQIATTAFVASEIAAIPPSATDLAYDPDTRVLASSTGVDITLPEVVASGTSGLITGGDKAKLDGIESGAQVNSVTSVNGQTGSVTIAELADGDKGDITVSNSGGTWTIDDTTVTPQKLSLYYANQASFPNASTYHGSIAHSHADGRMYFAHNSSWNPLASVGDLNWNSITSKPTTLSGYGITDAATSAQGTLASTALQPGADINTLAGPLNVNKGGTGQTAYSRGDVLLGTSAGSLQRSSLDTGAIIVPVGTTAQRPSSPVIGMIRFNSELGTFEGYNGASWGALSGGGEPTVFDFQGDLGTLTGDPIDLQSDTGSVDLMN